MFRDVVDQDSDRCRNRPDLTDGPVPQDADDLFVPQRSAPYLLPQQAGGDVVACLRADRAPNLQQLDDVTLELAGDLCHGRPILSKSRLVILLCPETQRFIHFRWPTEKGTLNPHGEPMGKLADELYLVTLQLRLDKVRGDLATLRFERLHALRPKIGFDNAAIFGVLGGIHSVRNVEMPGYGVAEGVGVVQYADDILVPKQGPPQEVAVRDRTPLAHLIVGCTLITQDSIGSRVPILLKHIVHGHFFLIVSKRCEN